jgi:hypothetical protein
VDQNLQSSHNRDPRYYTIVSADARAAYVFPVGSAQLAAAQGKMVHSRQNYRRFTFDNYTIFQPV